MADQNMDFKISNEVGLSIFGPVERETITFAQTFTEDGPFFDVVTHDDDNEEDYKSAPTSPQTSDDSKAKGKQIAEDQDLDEFDGHDEDWNILDSNDLGKHDGKLPLLNKFMWRMGRREQKGLPSVLPEAVPKMFGFVKNSIAYAKESFEHGDFEDPRQFLKRKQQEQQPLPVYTGKRLEKKDAPFVPRRDTVAPSAPSGFITAWNVFIA